MKLVTARRAFATVSIVTATAAATLAFPSAAFAQNVSGKTQCAGGPTHYAGVKYYANSANGGQIIFETLDLTKPHIYDMWDYGDRATVYSPWSSARWWVEANSVHSAVSHCS